MYYNVYGNSILYNFINFKYIYVNNIYNMFLWIEINM